MSDTHKASKRNSWLIGNQPWTVRVYGMVGFLCFLSFIILSGGLSEPVPAAFYVLIPIGGILYLLPALIAAHRHHKSKIAIFALNLLLGWALIGWVGALVWALTSPKPETPVVIQQAAPASMADELSKLAELRDKGVLTESEFEARKKALLS